VFVPGQYRQPDDSWPIDLIRLNPLALLISNGAKVGIPFATHLPIILDPDRSEDAFELSKIRLFGHMNKANPHWRALPDQGPVLAAFTGPNAYVSPTVYEKTPAAPTWNFAAVHVQAALQKLESHEETIAVVKATVRAFETDFGTGWDMSESLDYFSRILPGVGAFYLDVQHVDSMFKFSQEQSPEIQERVRTSFARHESTQHRDTATLMCRLARAGAEGNSFTPGGQ